MNEAHRETAITQQCLSHLSKETELLQHYIQVSMMIHDNLGVSTEVLEDENDPLAKLGKQTTQMEKERLLMTAAIAQYLGVPEQQATVRTLLDTLGEENRKLLAEKRDELLGLEASIQQQNRTNSFLIRHTIDLYQRIAMELSDQRPAATTYSATGALSSDSTTNLLQTDC